MSASQTSASSDPGPSVLATVIDELRLFEDSVMATILEFESSRQAQAEMEQALWSALADEERQRLASRNELCAAMHVAACRCPGNPPLPDRLVAVMGDAAEAAIRRDSVRDGTWRATAGPEGATRDRSDLPSAAATRSCPRFERKEGAVGGAASMCGRCRTHWSAHAKAM